jgi:membrane protease YdiL (CAAX protease family)
MSAVRAFAMRHPVLSYYALVFTISWGGILIVVGPTGVPGEPEDVARLFPFTLVALFAGPSVAGVMMTGLVYGKAGLRDLLARLVRWRVGTKWWAASLLIGPVLVAAVLFGLSLYSPDFVPGLLTTEAKLGLVIFGLSWGLVGGGLLEELGWTGFAVPALRQRYGALTSGLIVGLLGYVAPADRVLGESRPCRRGVAGELHRRIPRLLLRRAHRVPRADGVGLRSYREPAARDADARRAVGEHDHSAAALGAWALHLEFPARGCTMGRRRGGRDGETRRALAAARCTGGRMTSNPVPELEA